MGNGRQSKSQSSHGERSLQVELEIRIKTYDIDIVGHVNNAVYVRWLEDLRVHLLDIYCPLEGLLEQHSVPVIVTTQIHYRLPIVFADHVVRGQLWIEKLGLATFNIAAQFCVGDDIKATATQRGTFIDTRTHRPIKIPTELQHQYEKANGA